MSGRQGGKLKPLKAPKKKGQEDLDEVFERLTDSRISHSNKSSERNSRNSRKPRTEQHKKVLWEALVSRYFMNLRDRNPLERSSPNGRVFV